VNKAHAVAPPSTLLLGALTALTALSIDMSLPALPSLSRTFHAPAAEAQLTLTLFLIGYAISQIICGPLSDAYGRRPILLAGLIVFTAAGAGCVLSQSLPMLIAMRVLQGIGASSGPIIARAIVRDTYDKSHAAVVFSHITQVMILAPVLAPALGGLLMAKSSWHAIFAVLAGAGLLVTVTTFITLKETHSAAHPDAVRPATLLASYRTFFSDRTSVAHALIVCFAYCGLFAYISGSPFVLMDVYGIPRIHFGFYFGGAALALLAGATINKSLIRQGTSPERLLRIGVMLLTFAGAAIFAGSFVHGLGVWPVLIPIALYLFAMGIVAPHATAAAMHPFPKIAGVISSLVGGMQTGGGGLSGSLTGALYDHTAHPMGGVMCAMGILAFAAYEVARRSGGHESGEAETEREMVSGGKQA